MWFLVLVMQALVMTGCLLVFVTPAAADSTEPKASGLSIFAPTNGGTPRDAKRIEAVGPGQFRIRASTEEESSVLTRAVSRVDMICRNDGGTPETVTLHLELSDDGRLTNANNRHFGGMSKRDYLYIQPPGQTWKRIDGKASGWVCTFQFAVPPGETKVGLNPGYTYADYLRFIQTLPEHPHLTKTRIGNSDGDRPPLGDARV